MREKYIVYFGEDVVLGMIHDDLRKEIHIGGNKRFQPVMESMIREYFDVPLPKCRRVDNSKIRFRLYNIPRQRFTNAIACMQAHSYVLDSKTALGRLIR